MPDKNRAICKVNAMSQAQLIKHLLDGNLNCRELADATGLHYITVLQYCRELHKAGAIHIADWDADSRGRHVIKVYKLGAKPDTVAPKVSSAVRSERWRARRRLAAQVGLIGGVQ